MEEMMAQSIAAWRAKLCGKPLAWLEDQRDQWNGPTYRMALEELVREKRSRGEEDEACGPPKIKFVRVFESDDADDMVVEHIPYGGQGQTLRVEVPRATPRL